MSGKSRQAVRVVVYMYRYICLSFCSGVRTQQSKAISCRVTPLRTLLMLALLAVTLMMMIMLPKVSVVLQAKSAFVVKALKHSCEL